MCTPNMTGGKPAAAAAPVAANQPLPEPTPAVLGSGAAAKAGKTLMSLKQIRDQQIKDAGG